MVAQDGIGKKFAIHRIYVIVRYKDYAICSDTLGLCKRVLLVLHPEPRQSIDREVWWNALS